MLRIVNSYSIAAQFLLLSIHCKLYWDNNFIWEPEWISVLKFAPNFNLNALCHPTLFQCNLKYAHMMRKYVGYIICELQWECEAVIEVNKFYIDFWSEGSSQDPFFSLMKFLTVLKVVSSCPPEASRETGAKLLGSSEHS